MKQLKEAFEYEGVNTRIRDQREVRENITEDGRTKQGSGEWQNKEEWGGDGDEMDMTETTGNSNEHSKYVGAFLRIRSQFLLIFNGLLSPFHLQISPEVQPSQGGPKKAYTLVWFSFSDCFLLCSNLRTKVLEQ